jgi:hypothetical protein
MLEYAVDPDIIQVGMTLVSTLHADHLPVTVASTSSMESPEAELLDRLLRIGGGGWWRISGLSSGRSGDVMGEVGRPFLRLYRSFDAPWNPKEAQDVLGARRTGCLLMLITSDLVSSTLTSTPTPVIVHQTPLAISHSAHNERYPLFS